MFRGASSLTPSPGSNDRDHVVADSSAEPTPIRITEVEISQAIPDVSFWDEASGQSYARTISLVRFHSQPLGIVELAQGGAVLDASQHAHEIWRVLGSRIVEHLREDSLQPVTGLEAVGLPSAEIPNCLRERVRLLEESPLVSIVVPTRDRPERITNCLRSMLRLDYPRYEIIVVDNAPSSNATHDVIEKNFADFPHLRYVVEARPGCSWARNLGLELARGEIVAYADDDVVVDSHWLSGLVRGFQAAANVGCVTGLIFPAELETPAQIWFEEYGGFSKGFSRRIYDLGAHRPSDPLYPYTTGGFGTTANAAFRTSVLRTLGGFDPALGVGSLALGGPDLAAFFQVIAGGYQLVYEPSAIVHHTHRRDYQALKKQMYSYGVGLTAYLTKFVLQNPSLLLDIVPRVPYGMYYALSPRSKRNRKKTSGYPHELTRLERVGMLYGPLAYVRSRRHSALVSRQFPKTA